MKKLVVGLFLLFASVCQAEVIGTYNFDNLTSDWTCTLADCRLNPGCPSPFTSCGAAGAPASTQILTAADRTGGTNKRGFRVNIYNGTTGSGTPNDNYVKIPLSNSYSLMYIRWYQRDSTFAYGNFQKLFRIREGSSQIIIPEWQVFSGGTTKMNVWFSGVGNTYYDNWTPQTEGTPNQWYCYELKIDLANRVTQFWVDGVSQGSINHTNWPTGHVISTSISVSGNHSYVSGGAYIDMDDIVLSTDPVGCEGGEPPADTTAPTITNLTSATTDCGSDPRDVYMTWSTSEAATCRYHDTNTTWATMSAVTSTGGTSHYQLLSSLACDDSYSYNIKCQDAATNESDVTEITFSIDPPPDATPPTISAPSPLGQVACSTNPQAVTLQVTAEDSFGVVGCRYDTVDQSFGTMGNDFTKNGSTFTASVSVPCGTSRVYYARCFDGNNYNPTSRTISFSVDNYDEGSSSGTLGTGGSIQRGTGGRITLQ